MTSARRLLSVDEAVDLVVLHPPLGHWWLLVTGSQDGALRVASALAARAERHPQLPFARVQDQPDAELFLHTLRSAPNHALIFTAHPMPSAAFWRRLDKMRPRLRRAAPTILVLTEPAEADLRRCASHLSGWLSGQRLHVHDAAPIEVDTQPVTLYDVLVGLLPAQFEEVLFLLELPAHYLPGPSAPQGERSIALLRLLKQQERVAAIVPLLERFRVPRP